MIIYFFWQGKYFYNFVILFEHIILEFALYLGLDEAIYDMSDFRKFIETLIYVFIAFYPIKLG
jgi:hypothetical protein